MQPTRKISPPVIGLVLTAVLTMNLPTEVHALRGRGAAFVVGASVGSATSSTANANAAAAQQQTAAAQQQAAAAQQQAAAAEQQLAIEKQKTAEAQKQAAAAQQGAAGAGKAMPLGTVVPSLPSGCSSVPSGGVNYYKCGSDTYQAVYEGSTLKYVTTSPK